MLMDDAGDDVPDDNEPTVVCFVWWDASTLKKLCIDMEPKDSPTQVSL